jgi:hypothetical protein
VASPVAGAGVQQREQPGERGQRGHRDRRHRSGVDVGDVDGLGDPAPALAQHDRAEPVRGNRVGEQDEHRRYHG